MIWFYSILIGFWDEGHWLPTYIYLDCSSLIENQRALPSVYKEVLYPLLIYASKVAAGIAA